MVSNVIEKELMAFDYFGPFNSFEQKILLAFIEGLAIAIVILLVGLVANRILERFKANQTVKSEFNKLRVEKTIEVWEKLYAFHRATWKPNLNAQLTNQLIKFFDSPDDSSDDVFEKLQKSLEEAGKNVVNNSEKLWGVIYGNEMWMNDEFKGDAERYLLNLKKYTERHHRWIHDRSEIMKQCKVLSPIEYSKKSRELTNIYLADQKPIIENLNSIDRVNVESVLKGLLRSGL